MWVARFHEVALRLDEKKSEPNTDMHAFLAVYS